MRYREILEACWKGYRKDGMKTMFGKRYPNCVKVKKTNEESGVAEGSLDDIEDTKQFRDAVALAKTQKAIRQAKYGKDTKFYADGTPVTPEEIARRAAERKARQQGVAETEQLAEKCWDGYRQQGMKKKGDRQVPNCVAMSEQELEEDLKKWFKDKWVRFGPDGKIRGDCARGSSKEGKPKCLPRSKAQSLGKKGRASAASRKRRQDPNPNRSGAAKNVATKKK